MRIPHGLMYYKVRVNGLEIMAKVDIGVTHNFIKMETTKDMGLQARPTTHTMKAVNSAASNSAGLIKNVHIYVGSWNRRIDLLAVAMDDYDLVLGNKFLRRAKAFVAPNLGGILNNDEASPCFVASKSSSSPLTSDRVLSAMQVKKGMRKGEPTFL